MSPSNPSHVPISFNGHSPPDGHPDILWDVLSWMLVLVADRGKEVRYYGNPSGERIYLLANGYWFDFVPPFWKPHHLRYRLPALLGGPLIERPYSPQMALNCSARPRFFWEGPITLAIGQQQATVTCRVVAIQERLAIRFLISTENTSLPEVASKVLPEFQKQIPYDKMSAEFWFDKNTEELFAHGLVMEDPDFPH